MRKLEEPKGIIKDRKTTEKFILNRIPPRPELDYIIEHFWSVRWDLNDSEKMTQQVLSHPNLHITNENSISNVHGVVMKRFEKVLEGSGYVFAIKFKPASFTYLTQCQISNLTDKVLPVSEIIGNEFYEIFQRPMEDNDEIKKTKEISSYILELKHEPDIIAQRLNTIIEIIKMDSSITNLNHLEAIMNMNIRNIQRIFKKYVGISPKWIIKRYRLQEAMEKIESFQGDDMLTGLAYELGYFDQAHFIKDFKNLIGKTPGEYRNEIREINLIREN